MRPLVALVALVAVGLLAGGAAFAAEPGSIGAELTVSNGSLVVDNIDEGGPAAKAGVRAGDVIVRINDLAVKEKGLTAKDVEAAGKEIAKHKPGEKIKLTVKRDGKERKLDVTVGK
jgi:putative serine protease PepD